MVVSELNQIKQEHQKKAAHKETWAKPKRLRLLLYNTILKLLGE